MLLKSVNNLYFIVDIVDTHTRVVSPTVSFLISSHQEVQVNSIIAFQFQNYFYSTYSENWDNYEDILTYSYRNNFALKIFCNFT